MSLSEFRKAVDEVTADFSPSFRHAIVTTATSILRDQMSAAREGRHMPFWDFWVDATVSDFVAAAGEVRKHFQEQTSEKVSGQFKLGGAMVRLRPSAIWMEGRSYRIRLARCWSTYTGDGSVQWTAEITDFSKLCVYNSLWPATRKKFTADTASEHNAEKAMRELFEQHYQVDLLTAAAV